MLGSGWGSWPGEVGHSSEHAGHRAVRVDLCISLFVLYILHISIVVVTAPYVCCSVKLPLSQLMSFFPFSFHSPPHPSGVRGDRAASWPYVAAMAKLQHLGRTVILNSSVFLFFFNLCWK